MNLRQPVIARHTIAIILVFIGVSVLRLANSKNTVKVFPVVLFGQKDIYENIQWAIGVKNSSNAPPSAAVIHNPVDRLIYCWDFMSPTQREMALRVAGLPTTTTYSGLFSLPRLNRSWQDHTCGFPA